MNYYELAAFISWLTELTDYRFSSKEIADMTGYMDKIYLTVNKEQQLT